MSILMIVNPKAGRQLIMRDLQEIRELFEKAGNKVSVLYTKKQGDASTYVKRFASSCSRLVCCGGDGTLSEIVNGLMFLDEEQRPILGYIPAGTTNDFANSLGLPMEPVEAAELIIDGRHNVIDVGKFDDEYFIYVASFGAFTKSSYSTSQSMKNIFGHFAYVLEGMKELTSLTKYNIEIDADGKKYKNEYILGAVSNSTSIAGMIKLDEDLVSFNDGLFELMMIHYPNNPVELSRTVASLRSGDYDKDVITFLHAKKATFHFESPAAWSLDGEFSQGQEIVTIENVPRAFRLIH